MGPAFPVEGPPREAPSAGEADAGQGGGLGPPSPGPVPAWPDIAAADIARRLLTVQCIGASGASRKAIGFNLVLIPRPSRPEWPNPIPVATQYYDSIVSTTSIGGGHYQALELALRTMRERRPDWVTAHLAVQTPFWEVDQLVRRGTQRKMSLPLRQYRLAAQREVALQVCTTKATTWRPNRRKEFPAKYASYFAKLDARLLQMLRGELIDPSQEHLWVDLYAVGRAAQAIRDKAGRDPSLLEALSYHVVRQRKRKAVHLAEAAGLDAKAVRNALFRAKAAMTGVVD